MDLCFVDESGTPAKPDSEWPRYFVIGGLIVPEEQWHTLSRKFAGLKTRWRYRGELKWRYFAPQNTDANNPMLRWTQDNRNEFREEIFDLISRIRSIRIIAGVSDAPLAYQLGNVYSQSDIYFRTYKVVTERFQYFLQDISRQSGYETRGIIIADHRGNRDDNKLRLQHQRLVEEDGRYSSTYENLIEGLFLAPSHMSLGIQFADMVAGAIWRQFEANDRTFLDSIRSSLRTDNSGRIDGYGIARFPKAGWTGPIIR